jgi:hypothetical protein
MTRAPTAAKQSRTTDLGSGWFATIEDDGSLTIRGPDKGQRITLEAQIAARLRVMLVAGRMDAEKREAYTAGRAAFKIGRPLSDCPKIISNAIMAEWRRGWLNAQEFGR